MSHTAKIKVEYRDADAFRAACEACGYTWIGEGRHGFYRYNPTDGFADGLGFKIPGWSYPAVLTADGTLAFDDSSRMHYGRTADKDGKIPEFDALARRYALEAARNAATAQGWYSEMQGDQLVIYHPDNGTLTVTADGKVDANSFTGPTCADAVSLIGNAMGTPVETVAKPAYYQQFAQIAQGE